MNTRAMLRITLGVLAALTEMALLTAGAASADIDGAIHLKLRAAYTEAGECSKAEPLYRQALAIEENALAKDGPVLAEDLILPRLVKPYTVGRATRMLNHCAAAHSPFASTSWARNKCYGRIRCLR